MRILANEIWKINEFICAANKNVIKFLISREEMNDPEVIVDKKCILQNMNTKYG